MRIGTTFICVFCYDHFLIIEICSCKSIEIPIILSINIYAGQLKQIAWYVIYKTASKMAETVVDQATNASTVVVQSEVWLTNIVLLFVSVCSWCFSLLLWYRAVKRCTQWNYDYGSRKQIRKWNGVTRQLTMRIWIKRSQNVSWF